MSRTTPLALAALGLFLAGCSQPPATPAPDPTAPAAAPPEDVKAVADGINHFTFDLYQQVRSKPGNLVLSPASVSTALAMAAAGAKGQTAEQLDAALTVRLTPQRLHPAYAALIRSWTQPGEKRPYRLELANSLWGAKGAAWRDEYLRLVRDSYSGGLEEVDFADAEAARATINDWVAGHTGQRIKDIIPPGGVDAATRLVVANAVYFKGDWVNLFRKDATRATTFYLSAGEGQPVPTMSQTNQYGYALGEDVAVLQMPYAGEELAMVILLPHQITGFDQFEKSLSVEKVNGWLEKLERQEVGVYLPRFKLEWGEELSGRLRSLGVQDAFDPMAADFSGMNGTGNLFVRTVRHRAFVEVNEEGTEAAGATVLEMPKSAPGEGAPRLPPVFRADHPFVFLIRDLRTGAILFLGRVADPRT
jgi:serpin B